MKKLMIVAVLMFSVQLVFAQNPPAKKGERVQAMRVAMLSNALNLDEATAQKFWPIFNAYSDSKKMIQQEKRTYMQTLGDARNLSDVEIDKALNGMIACAQKEVDLQKKYKTEFLRVISAKQLATLFQAEKDFKELLISKMKGGAEDVQEQGRRRWNRIR
jgi:Spy/CpxP family protein refolding chaperone